MQVAGVFVCHHLLAQAHQQVVIIDDMGKPSHLDIIILILLAMLLVPLWASLDVGGGSMVSIHADGGQWLYPLDQDRTVEVEGPLGVTTIQIEDGSARIISSPCPTRSCMRMEASMSPESLVCLPNRVSVSITGGPEDVDVIVY